MNDYNFDAYRTNGFTTISNLLIQNYAKIGLSETQFLLVIQLESSAQAGDFLPENSLLASRTNLSLADVGIGLQSLIDQNFIEIVQITDNKNRIQNQYSLTPLYDKLNTFLEANRPLTKADKIIPDREEQDDPIASVTRQFEVEFGRLLSPMEREMIQNWFTIDHYDAEVIQLALRESVLAQVYNFKYIDRILLNWQRMNLKTSAQVKNYLHQ